MDSIVKWYIERAIEEERSGFADKGVFEIWKQSNLLDFERRKYSLKGRLLLRALELAVKDTGSIADEIVDD